MKVAVFLLALWIFSLPAQAASDVDAFRQDTLRSINAFRKAEGRSPVRLDATLNGVSQEWAKKLAGDAKLKHRSLSTLRSLEDENGYGVVNENLFMSSQDAAPAEVVDAWEHSSGHRRNLLQKEIDRIGIGVAESAGGGCYVVFNGAGAMPSAAAPVPDSGAITFGGSEATRP